MRRIESYIRKYGPVDGPIIYRTLQSQAAHARAKALYRDRLAAGRPRRVARTA
jgi:hypothetical protein